MSRLTLGASVVISTVLLFSGSSGASGMWFATSTGSFDVPVRSMQELKFTETIRQGFDFSCGSAALATLLTYHYGRERNELQVFRKMWEEGDQERIKTGGFSMLDMKRFIESEGLRADGYKISAEKIGEVGVAGIVLLEHADMPHFVVVVGEQDGELLISDPARGVWNLPVDELEKLWNGVFFVIRNEATLARGNFNDSETWRRRRWSPIDDGRMAERLVPVPIDLPLPTEFNVN